MQKVSGFCLKFRKHYKKRGKKFGADISASVTERVNVDFSKIPIEIMKCNKIPTKRQFLKIVMSVFDPLGFLSPVTIQARLIMQNIWESNVKWDEEISIDDHKLWIGWIHILEIVKLVRLG